MYQWINGHSFTSGFLLILLYHIPYLILGKETLYMIGDNLDSAVLYLKLIANNDTYFSIDNKLVIDSFMSGSVPRNALPSSLNIISLLFLFFETSTAYILSRILVSVVAIIGMYFFIIKNIITDPKYRIFALLISYSFAILQHKPIYGGASFVIAPLFFYLFLNLVRNKNKNLSLVFIFFAPFLSSVVMSTVFIWMVLCIILIVFCVKKKKILRVPSQGIVLMLIGMILADIHLFLLNFLDFSFTVHRVTRVLALNDFFSIINRASLLFINQKSSPIITLHHPIFYWFLVILIAGALKNRYSIIKPIFMFTLIFFNCVFSYISSWDILQIIRSSFELFTTFDFSRLKSLNPFYWWALLAIIIKEILTIYKKKPKLIFLFLIFLFFSGPIYIVKNSSSYRANITKLIYNNDDSFEGSMMTIENFYSPNLFEEIENWIDKPKSTYKVGSIGLHPAVSAYNQFYTIDGYSNYYNIYHNKRFRDIIEPELKQDKLLNKFDHWGNRCYLFSKELLTQWDYKNKIISKKNMIKIDFLNFNFKKVKDLKCEYLFSTVKINVNKNKKIIFENSFERKDSPYKIYLYKII